MSDQAERVVLEAEDQVSPVVDKANAGLDSFEKKAESAHGKVIRITDQTRSSVQRLIASLEKQADVYGKSGVERLVAQRDQLLQRYAKEPAAIDAITRSYEKMIAVEEKAAREALAVKAAKEAEEALRKQSEAIKSFGERVGQFMENPLQGAKGAVGSLLSSLGPFGVGVMAGATALVGLGAAAFEAAKSLGEYGTQVKDAELRTGLTAKEVGQFGFAARAVGQDISIVERLMRGLSQAADDNSKAGEKARATLRGMGIDLHTAGGEMKPTSQMLGEIAEGLDRLPEGVARDAAAMDLFKRVGVEAIPFMTELNANLRIAREQGFGPTEDDIRRFSEYQREVAELETNWDRLVRKFKEGLVVTVSFVGKGVDWFLNNVATAGDEARSAAEERAASEFQQAGGIGASQSRSGRRGAVAAIGTDAQGFVDSATAHIKHLEEQRSQLLGGLSYWATIAPTDDELARMKRGQELQRQIEELRGQVGIAQGMVRQEDLAGGKTETERLRARFFGTHEGMERAYSDAKKDVERLQRELFEPEKPLTRSQATELGRQLGTAEATEARWKTALDAEARGTEQLKEFRRQAAEFEKKGDDAELDALGKIYHERDLLLQQAAQVKASEVEIAAIRKAADEQASTAFRKDWEKFEAYDQKRGQTQGMAAARFGLPSKKELQESIEGFEQEEKDRKTLAKDLLGYQEAMIRLQSGPGGELETAQKIFALRVQSAETLVEKQAAALDYLKQAAQIQAESDQAHQEEMDREADAIASKSSSLLHTLFTRPQEFGQQLGGVLHEAVLKPVTEGLGGMLGNVLRPIVYGAEGTGGIAGVFNGVFGGKQDSVKLSTDMNTTATLQNSAVMAGLTAILAAGMGMAAPAIASPAGIAGISLPAISAPFVSGGGLATGAGSLFSGGSAGGGGGAPMGFWGGGGTVGAVSPAPGFTPEFLRAWTGSYGGGSAATSAGNGSLGMLRNLRGKFWNSGSIQTNLAGTDSTTAAGIGGLKGDLAGVLTSQGAASLEIAGGMPLAMAGLTGSRRGTWGGIAESTAGGALVGAGIGTMVMPGIGTLVGAGIGAAAGFGASVGEKLFGVKSLQQTAHDDIKSVYGVDIPTNSGTIKQVVSLAQSQFGGSISVAVRSPSVRQLVMLYSEATGQKMPLSATTPYAGSLVEQGGNLYQQASFQNNAWHMYSSNLPTLGGIAGSTYPTPGGPNTAGGAGPTYLSLNVSGAALAPFMTGQYVTPEFVTDQSMAAQGSGYGRTQQAANMQLPGLTVA